MLCQSAVSFSSAYHQETTATTCHHGYGAGMTGQGLAWPREPQIERNTHMKSSIRLVLLPACTLVLLALGCTGSDPTATPPAIPTASPVPTATTPPVSPTATSEPSPTATSQDALPEELFLEIIGPADETVVSQATIVVQGITTPDAVVSIGDETVEVDVQGEFAVQVSLEIGPNIIEVVASNMAGGQESVLLSLVYVP